MSIGSVSRNIQRPMNPEGYGSSWGRAFERFGTGVCTRIREKAKKPPLVKNDSSAKPDKATS